MNWIFYISAITTLPIVLRLFFLFKKNILKNEKKKSKAQLEKIFINKICVCKNKIELYPLSDGIFYTVPRNYQAEFDLPNLQETIYGEAFRLVFTNQGKHSTPLLVEPGLAEQLRSGGLLKLS